MTNTGVRYSCIIIDDEFSSIDILKEYISQIPRLELIKIYLNPISGLKALQSGIKVDILFLDINMAVSGLDIARMVRNQVKSIIFTTGHAENALAAFGVNADAFLVKPFDFKRFLQTINNQIVKNFSDPIQK
ncbi:MULTISPECIES: LytTR family DNA-binding domain-containing protein [Pedobacter]|uniref:LytR/AlgR family response regulator transcription factor n=1 Tax=Pedobacter TaxID=84567 RepID=UPI00120B3488|nr:MULTISPECIES: response regulator [Pedobacter]RZJ89235.1 MAG: response regulator [Chryseobacterium sp.]